MCYSAQIERDWQRFLALSVVALMLSACSSNVLLTPQPIDIGPEEKTVSSPTNFSVQNERAALHVHLADLSKAEFAKIIEGGMNYPAAARVHPAICTANGNCVALTYAGISLGNTDVEGIYRADWSRTDTQEFSSARIRADEEIKNVTLIWKPKKK